MKIKVYRYGTNPKDRWWNRNIGCRYQLTPIINSNYDIYAGSWKALRLKAEMYGIHLPTSPAYNTWTGISNQFEVYDSCIYQDGKEAPSGKYIAKATLEWKRKHSQDARLKGEDICHQKHMK